MKIELDRAMVSRGLVQSRSQADSYIKLGLVNVNKVNINQPTFLVEDQDKITLSLDQQYVSRAALKLESVAIVFGIDFKHKTVLDVGSSTGGFTDYALKHDAKKIIAVEVGSNQLHPTLRQDKRIELHEQTDIRNIEKLHYAIDLILVDVSFVSLKAILPHLVKLANTNTQLIVMFKPQFEVGDEFKNKGIIKNEKIRRNAIQEFELWLKSNDFVILNKADSKVEGSKGNKEKFYQLKITSAKA